MEIKINGERIKILRIILLRPVYLIIVSAYNNIMNEYKKILTLLKKIVFFGFTNKKQAMSAVAGIKKGRIILLLRTGIVSLTQFFAQILLPKKHSESFNVDVS